MTKWQADNKGGEKQEKWRREREREGRRNVINSLALSHSWQLLIIVFAFFAAALSALVIQFVIAFVVVVVAAARLICLTFN